MSIWLGPKGVVGPLYFAAEGGHTRILLDAKAQINQLKSLEFQQLR